MEETSAVHQFECNHIWKPLGQTVDDINITKATIFCEVCGEIRSQKV